jgi:hypothetical protein
MIGFYDVSEVIIVPIIKRMNQRSDDLGNVLL